MKILFDNLLHTQSGANRILRAVGGALAVFLTVPEFDARAFIGAASVFLLGLTSKKDSSGKP